MTKLQEFAGYAVDEYGKVYSLKFGKVRVLNQYNHKGYKRVRICGKNMTVHRLVCMAFIPNPENKPVINHKDGVKDNNCVTNLEWATVKENNNHMWNTLGIERHSFKKGNSYGK